MRVTAVKSARKPQGSCGSCGDTIGVGDPYRWIKPRYGAKRVRCMKPECGFRQSDLTSNDKLATVYGAVESVQDTLGMWGEVSPVEDLTSALEDAAEQIRGASEEWTESAESIREHFTESEQADTAEENAEMAEEFAGQIEEVKDEVEALEPEEGEEPTKPCPTCAAQRAEMAGELNRRAAMPPEAATVKKLVRDVKVGDKVLKHDTVLTSTFGGGLIPSATYFEVLEVRGPSLIPGGGDKEHVKLQASAAMGYLFEADLEVSVLREDVDWAPGDKKGTYRWYWVETTDEIEADKPAIEIGCIDCDDTGEVPLGEDDDWREEAKGLVEGVLQEMPL